MNPITVKNSDGDTIDIKFDADGRVEIRHSAINPAIWAELREYAKRLRQPSVRKFFAKKGIEITPVLDEIGGKMGGYIVLDGQTYMIGAGEVSIIHEAIRQAGGIVPNWASH